MHNDSDIEHDKLPSAPPVDALSVDVLRLRCDPNSIPFESTADVDPVQGVIGQDAAVEALRFGLQIHAPGQNVFVRGLKGTGRMTLISRLLDEIRLACPLAKDRCYVHNFAEPDRPQLITLDRGRGPVFRRAVDHLADFIRDDLSDALKSDGQAARGTALEQKTQAQIEKLVDPFEKLLRDSGFGLASVQVGAINQAAIFPLVDGEPVPPEEWDQLRAAGKIPKKELARVRKRRDELEPELQVIAQQVGELRRELTESLRALREETTRLLLGEHTARIKKDFSEPTVHAFLSGLLDDVATRPIDPDDEGDRTQDYRVNVVISRSGDDSCPMIVEDTPTVKNLLGTIEPQWTPDGGARTDYTQIRAGSLLRADGGYLILDARDLMRDSNAWHVLVRTLRTGRLEITPQDVSPGGWGPSLKPEPINLDIKVVLLGDAETYHYLDSTDPDFPHLFKVLADFDSSIPRNEKAIAQYGGVIARIVREQDHPHFDQSAVAVLVEHGSRIAGRQDRLTTRFGRLVDIAHEAAFIAKENSEKLVSAQNIRAAIRRSKFRAGLPSRQFHDMLADGTIRVMTSGTAVGQVNGLAVSQLGPLTFGFPTRITATIGPGSAGVINIEREAELSGAIHTKGFYILVGLLRHLLQTGHPLAFHASIAFEQSYGGIDGDSASTAEICCLLSALTDIPIRQDLAITGAIDQVGNILAVGATNEKIEGFFDTCSRVGLTGTQGVIIPKSNATDLMLREDVVEACAANKFRIYVVDRVEAALELLTGVVAGERDDQGDLPTNSILGTSVLRAFEYWVQAVRTVEPLELHPEESGGVEEAGIGD